jgi:hypothetical protein
MRMRVDDQQKERVMLNLGGGKCDGLCHLHSAPLHSTQPTLAKPDQGSFDSFVMSRSCKHYLCTHPLLNLGGAANWGRSGERFHLRSTISVLIYLYNYLW